MAAPDINDGDRSSHHARPPPSTHLRRHRNPPVRCALPNRRPGGPHPEPRVYPRWSGSSPRGKGVLVLVSLSFLQPFTDRLAIQYSLSFKPDVLLIVCLSPPLTPTSHLSDDSRHGCRGKDPKLWKLSAVSFSTRRRETLNLTYSTILVH